MDATAFLATPAAFGAWREQHHASSQGLWVRHLYNVTATRRPLR